MTPCGLGFEVSISKLQYASEGVSCEGVEERGGPPKSQLVTEPSEELWVPGCDTSPHPPPSL